MNGLQGYVDMAVFPVDVQAGFLDLWASNLVLALLTAGGDSSKQLNCMVVRFEVEDGIMKTNNAILDSTDIIVRARGEINLRNEQLELAFRAKPREGIGISLGTVVNELLEVRGTLKSPRIGVDAGRTATATGAAVATGGLSLLARGLWDRISAEGDICAEDSKRQ